MKNIKTIGLIFLLAFAAQVKAADNPAIAHLIKAYIGIKDALVTDNSKAANAQAKQFTAAVAEVNSSTLDADQKAAWVKYAEKLRFNADHIGESQSIDHQREHFANLSNDMYTVIKAIKTDVTLYRQYCPMKKNYWLSQSKNIANPYYGGDMPDCGKVTETLGGK